MAVNLLCLTADSGIPLFARHKGHADPIPFSMVASLNGVHMFGKTHGVKFINTKTKKSMVVWKEFEESVMLIAVSFLNNDELLNEILDLVFGAMVFFVSLEELKSARNIERVKRELRACYPVVDKILEALDFSDKNLFVDLLSYDESLALEETGVLNAYLNSYAECCTTQYACIAVDNRIAVATDAWWELSKNERKLLLYLLSCNSNCTCFDIAVFLPQNNSPVAVRAVGVLLAENVFALALCGPQPELIAVERIAFQCWSPALGALQSIRLSLPQNLNLHSSILGFLLIDFIMGKYLCYMFTNNPRKDGNRPSNNILRTFYYQSGYLLVKPESGCIETYWCSEYHKVHGIKRDPNLLCVLYTSSVPTHTLRTITMETLDLLTSGTYIPWN